MRGGGGKRHRFRKAPLKFHFVLYNLSTVIKQQIFYRDYDIICQSLMEEFYVILIHSPLDTFYCR